MVRTVPAAADEIDWDNGRSPGRPWLGAALCTRRAGRDQEHLLAEQPLEWRDAQVDRDQQRRLRQAGLCAEGHEARPALAYREPGQLQRLAHALVAERDVVVQEVPVLPVGVLDVRLEDDDLAARPQQALRFA